MNELSAVEAEIATIGCILINGDTFTIIRGVVSSDDFSSTDHATVFEAMADADIAGDPAGDITLLCSRLQNKSKATTGSWLDLLSAATESVGSSANAEKYARLVWAHSEKRKLVASLQEQLAVAKVAPPEQVASLRTSVIRQIESAASEDNTKVMGVGSLIGQYRDEVRKLGGSWNTKRVPTCITKLDQWLTGGLPVGGWTIIAGRPSDGKSSLALSMVSRMAKSGGPVLLISIESYWREVVFRLSRIVTPMEQFCSAYDDRNKQMCESLVDANLWRLEDLKLDITHSKDVDDIVYMVRHFIAKHPDTQAVVIDYFSKLTAKNCRKNSDLEKYNYCLDRLDDLRQYAPNQALVLLAQLNRSVDEKSPPQLYHLKETGRLEQDADCVMILHTPEEHLDKIHGPVEVYVRKHRNGPKGCCQLMFNRPKFEFYDPNAWCETGTQQDLEDDFETGDQYGKQQPQHTAA